MRTGGGWKPTLDCRRRSVNSSALFGRGRKKNCSISDMGMAVLLSVILCAGGSDRAPRSIVDVRSKPTEEVSERRGQPGQRRFVAHARRKFGEVKDPPEVCQSDADKQAASVILGLAHGEHSFGPEWEVGMKVSDQPVAPAHCP